MRRRIMAARRTTLPTKTIKNVKEIGRHAMGGNLYLTVSRTKAGELSRRWTFKYRSPALKDKRGQPKPIELGFGAVAKVSPEEAQKRAAQARDMLARGNRPIVGQGRFSDLQRADIRAVFRRVLSSLCGASETAGE